MVITLSTQRPLSESLWPGGGGLSSRPGKGNISNIHCPPGIVQGVYLCRLTSSLNKPLEKIIPTVGGAGAGL